MNYVGSSTVIARRSLWMGLEEEKEWSGGGKSVSLPREGSIFSAEAHAINMAVREIVVKEETQFVIMIDFRSVLSGLSDIRTSHPVCRATLHKINQLKDRNEHVRLCWVPRHVGIG